MQQRAHSKQKRNPIAAFLVVVLLAAVTLLGRATWAAPPTLTQVPDHELPNTFQANSTYTLSLIYKDPNGFSVNKSKAIFHDESGAGQLPISADNIVGETGSANGATITWTVRGLAQGRHTGYFEVTNASGKTRYPAEPTEFYTFGVEALATKYIILGIGAIVGMIGIPFIVYLIARATNKRGNPSSAARLGLLIGILAVCCLFIYLFANVYGPLVYAILIVGFLAAIVLLLQRR